MSFEVRGRCETPSYFLSICEFLPFNLWRCGRLIFFRLLFAIANNCLCQISDFENRFSVAICQIQQSTIATASLGLLKPAAVVSKIIGISFLFITRNEFRGKRSLWNALLFFVYLRVSSFQLVAPRQTCLRGGWQPLYNAYISSLLPFLRLQHQHNVWRLLDVVIPPLDIGMIWSISNNKWGSSNMEIPHFWQVKLSLVLIASRNVFVIRVLWCAFVSENATLVPIYVINRSKLLQSKTISQVIELLPAALI